LITLIESGIANIGSVVSAFRRIGVEPSVTADPGAVSAANALVLPGVGSFSDGMECLRHYNLVTPIRNAVTAGIPILGICLGMQLLAESGEEFGNHRGLGLIRGRVVRLQPAHSGQRVPNIGWCDVNISPNARLFRKIEDRTAMYFMHSYHLICSDDADTAAIMAFGSTPACVAVERGCIFGVQFHPEKSQDAGLRLLDNYVRYAKKRITMQAG
jgi:glutamine amidotransferase